MSATVHNSSTATETKKVEHDDSGNSRIDITLSEPIRVGVLTISDRSYQGIKEDLSGGVLADAIKSETHNINWELVIRRCVPDDQLTISMALIKWCDTAKLDLIITTGGTGISPRDLTPEATRAVLDKEMPGISTAIMVESLKITKMAMLSRLVCGVRKRTLIINFPGSPKACSQCFDVIKPVIKHAVDVLRGTKDPHEKTPKLKSKVNILQVARRLRQSPYPMITVDEAQRKILKLTYKMHTVNKKLQDALGFVLGQNIVAKEPFPPFRASMKDGYAVIAADGVGSRKVISSALAGYHAFGDTFLQPGECIRITTGAPVPKGATAVVQVEDTLLVSESDGGETETVIEVLKPPRLGQDIREIGSDMKKDEIIAAAGTVLTPAALGVLATTGNCEVPVIKKPRLAIMSTGSELQKPDEILQPGKIRDSNKTTLLALLKENGYSAYDCGIVKDDPNVLLNAIYRTLQCVDVLITTGGVSMGERDLVADVLMEDLNAKMIFGRVNMKPGKPTKCFYLPMEEGPKYVFALPGNPVSAVVTCHLFVFPSLRAMSGWDKPLPMLFKVQIPEAIELDDRYEYARAMLMWARDDGVPIATVTGNQVSSRLMNLVEADCLLHLPAASPLTRSLRAGSIVNAQMIKRHLTRLLPPESGSGVTSGP